MRQARFVSCGLECSPDEGVLLQFTSEDLEAIRKKVHDQYIRGEPLYESSNRNDVILEAVFRIMKEPGVFSIFDGYKFPEEGIFVFRPNEGFEESDKRAKYQICHVLLTPMAEQTRRYSYIVLDELKPGVDLRKERVRMSTSYRLRGVSLPMRCPTPSRTRFNDPYAWSFWSKEPQDFNLVVAA